MKINKSIFGPLLYIKKENRFIESHTLTEVDENQSLPEFNIV